MELKKFTTKLSSFAKKYRYVVIILLIGIIFMCLPSRNKSNNSTSAETEQTVPVESAPSLDASLSDILSRIQGAGDVCVLLTLQEGEETIYQTDSHISTSGDNNSSQVETVIISGSERNENGLIKQINPPIYMGAVVVCQGADHPTVRLAIVDAVSKVTGLGADRISVSKMK